MRAKLKDIKEKLLKRKHQPVGETGRWLRHVVRGWLGYHAVPGKGIACVVLSMSSRNSSMRSFVAGASVAGANSRNSRNSRNGRSWAPMQRLARKHLPRPRVTHPFPNKRFRDRLKVGAV